MNLNFQSSTIVKRPGLKRIVWTDKYHEEELRETVDDVQKQIKIKGKKVGESRVSKLTKIKTKVQWYQ